MFMFHSKRTKLTKQLVKARKRRTPDETSRRPPDILGFEDPTAAATTAGSTKMTIASSGSRLSPVLLNNNDGSSTSGQQLSLVIRKLKNGQLEMLASAVQSGGKRHNNCVLLPRDSDPHVVCCQAYRWPDVRHESELRRLPTCRTAADPIYICCNPYHWSRLLQPETPPPPYSRCTIDRLKPEDRAPSEVPIVFRDSYMGSLTTGGDANTRNPYEWCKLAYWELARRVGPLFPVDGTSVNVFGEATGALGDGLSLHTLAQSWASSAPDAPIATSSQDSAAVTFRYPNNGCHAPLSGAERGELDAVVRTRSKIGLGITLSREDDRIWLYNRSDYPVFVNSLSLDECSPHSNPHLSNAYPIRLPPDHCLCVHDATSSPSLVHHPNYHQFYTHHHHHHHHQQQQQQLQQQTDWRSAPHQLETSDDSGTMNNNDPPTTCVVSSTGWGPVDPNSIRISFVKGWGASRYSRREITSCPCWLEILLAPCR